jgi:hypothetical protein
MATKKKSTKANKPRDLAVLLAIHFTPKEFNRMLSRSGLPVDDIREVCASFEVTKD